MPATSRRLTDTLLQPKSKLSQVRQSRARSVSSSDQDQTDDDDFHQHHVLSFQGPVSRRNDNRTQAQSRRKTVARSTSTHDSHSDIMMVSFPVSIDSVLAISSVQIQSQSHQINQSIAISYQPNLKFPSNSSSSSKSKSLQAQLQDLEMEYMNLREEQERILYENLNRSVHLPFYSFSCSDVDVDSPFTPGWNWGI